MNNISLGNRFECFSPSTLVFIITLSFLCVSTGCLPGKPVQEIERVCLFPTDIENGGRLSVFLNLVRPDGPQVSIEVSSLEVLSGDQWLPLLSTLPLSLDSKEIGRGQIFVGSRELVAGSISRLRVTVENAYLIEKGGFKTPLMIGESASELALNEEILLTEGSSKTINLHWDVDESMVAGMFLRFHAAAIAASKTNLVTANLIYATCPDIDTIYIIRTDINQVVGSLGVEGQPAYLFIDPQTKRMYVMAFESNIIRVFDLVDNRLVDEVRLPLSTGLVSMAVDPDFEKAYVVDSSGYLMRVDLATGNMEERVRIGQQPAYVLYLEKQQRLAVSSINDNVVYIVIPNDMRFFDPITVGGEPGGLLEQDDLLYVSEGDSNTVSVYDMIPRKAVARINTGAAPYRLGEFNNRIYVTNRKDGTISMLKWRSPKVSKVMHVGENVQEMAYSDPQQYLYVGNGKCDGSLAVIDINRYIVVDRIELGAFPKGIVFLEL